MVYHFMYMDKPIADVTVGENNLVTSIVKFVPDTPMQLLWGDFSNATPQYMTNRLYVILKDRCYEDSRLDLPKSLEQAGMTSNNPYEWVKVSHGVMWEVPGLGSSLHDDGVYLW